jgi:negative regulator of sigma E activity
MGRVIRGERSVPGIEKLRQRISDELDDKSVQQESDAPDSVGPRYVRPLAGFAIAATVALAAIFGLQQITSMTDINTVPGNDSAPVAEAENNGAYTVPDQVDDQLREYYMRHNASSSYFGADSINARLVTLQLRDGVIVESDTEIVPVEEDEEKVDEESTGQAPL